MVISIEKLDEIAKDFNSAVRLDNKIKKYELEIDAKLVEEWDGRNPVEYEFPKAEKEIVVTIVVRKYEDAGFKVCEKRNNHPYGFSFSKRE